MRRAALAGGEIAWLEAGASAGAALVLLHGIGSAAWSWRAQIDAFADDMRVIAWNAPGYPPSAALSSDAARDAATYAKRLEVLLDHCGVTRCHLVGHSLGCLIAARFAASSPSRVASLTLASCALGHARLAAQERERLLESRLADVRDLGARGMAEKRGPRLLSPGASANLVSLVVNTMAQVDAQGYADAARMLSSGDLLSDIEALNRDVPMQFVWGEDDVITPPAANERAASVRPAARRVVLPQAGHACYLEQPGAFNAALRAFVRDHG